MALIGRPGANKSHPLSFAFHPFIEHDYRQNKEYQELYDEYERTMSMTKKERLEAGIYPRHSSTPTQQREEPRQEVRQEQHEESSLSVRVLDFTNVPATDPEEEMLAKQYVKKKKKPQRKRGFRL